ncbi:MAG TPA: hypothetical protein PKN78_09655, partial [Tenuifilaceae bacterium]|nr:hypothetical protein [Tenuifilaceae bacterium]
VSIFLKDNQVATNSIEGAFVEIIIHKNNQSILKKYKKKYYVTSNNIVGWRDMDDNNFFSTDGLVELIFQDLVDIISNQN